MDIEHPIITRTEATGYPWAEKRNCLRCEKCGAKIPEGERCYIVRDVIYCPDCAWEAFGYYA